MTIHSRSVALIGAGRWGKNLARNLYELGALHTICDRNEQLLTQFKSYTEVRLSSDLESILVNPEITSVMIATPAFEHYSVAKRALLAGKDLFVEKPLCMESSEAEELVKLAGDRGRILMVGHLLQYHPHVEELQSWVRSGELGTIHYIASHRLNLGSIRTEENALWNFAPHDISIILSLIGDQESSYMPSRVHSIGSDAVSLGVADISMTTLEFEDNVKAHIYVSWLNPFKEQKLTLVGSKGLALFDDTKPWNEKLTLYRNHVQWQGTMPEIATTHPEPAIIPQKEPLREECLHFLHCCKTRTRPKTDGEEGLRVLRVLEAAQSSLDKTPILSALV